MGQAFPRTVVIDTHSKLKRIESELKGGLFRQTGLESLTDTVAIRFELIVAHLNIIDAGEAAVRIDDEVRNAFQGRRSKREMLV